MPRHPLPKNSVFLSYVLFGAATQSEVNKARTVDFSVYLTPSPVGCAARQLICQNLPGDRKWVRSTKAYRVTISCYVCTPDESVSLLTILVHFQAKLFNRGCSVSPVILKL